MKGYRTLIFNALLAAIGTLDATVLNGVIPPQHIGLVMAGVGLVGMVLRSFSNTAITKSE